MITDIILWFGLGISWILYAQIHDARKKLKKLGLFSEEQEIEHKRIEKSLGNVIGLYLLSLYFLYYVY